MEPVLCCKCGLLCHIDGEYPKFIVWCDECNNYADIDLEELQEDYLGNRIDHAYEQCKEKR
jgi:hypothetical protein